MGRAKSFTEMAQLNLYLPKWQVDELERLAKLERTTRSKLAHKAIAKYINPTPTKEDVKPVFKEEAQAEETEWEELDTADIEQLAQDMLFKKD